METDLPVATNDRLQQAREIIIKDEIDMIMSANLYKEYRANLKTIDDFFDDKETGTGQWRDEKKTLDATKARWNKKRQPWVELCEIIDEAQRKYIESENEKKREQEELIKAQLLSQAEEQKAEQVTELLIQGREDEAQQLAAQETKKPIVNLKTPASISGQHQRKNLKIKVVDFSKLPSKFTKLVVDQEKLDEELKKYGEDTKVEGCVVWNDFSIVRTRK